MRVVVAALLILFAAQTPVLAVDVGTPMRLDAPALADFQRQRLRVPLLRIFDAGGHQVLEVRGWGDGMRPLDGLAAREPVPGLPTLSERLAEVVGATAELTEAKNERDYTALLYYADWCAICRRMEPELAEQIAEVAPLRLRVLRIEADPLRVD